MKRITFLAAFLVLLATAIYSIAAVWGRESRKPIVYTLDRQTGEFLWAKPTVMQNVVAGHRRRNRPGANQSGVAVQRGWRPALHLSDGARRKEFSSRRLQSADQHDVLRAAECVCDGDGRRKYSHDVLRHPEQ